MPSSPRGESATGSTAPRSSKFRFKDRSKGKDQRRSSRERSRSPSPRRHRRHHHHHSRRPRRPTSPPASPPVSPDTAFRESLFDALADDEGAAYWEGVYGQPIHTYARPYTAEGMRAAGLEGEPATHDADGNPILERMNDEEYATYVRKRMWEKSHQHIIEERERRERVRETERAEQKEEERRAQSARAEWEGRERRGRQMRGNGYDAKTDAKRWKERWQKYLAAWTNMDECAKELAADKAEAGNGAADDDEYTPQQPASQSKDKPWRKRPKLPYPMLSASTSEVLPDEIEHFYRSMVEAKAIPTIEKGAPPTATLAALLKAERVRWHPDKIAQRYGSLGLLDEHEQRRVTAIFQVVDTLYAKVLTERG